MRNARRRRGFLLLAVRKSWSWAAKEIFVHDGHRGQQDVVKFPVSTFSFFHMGKIPEFSTASFRHSFVVNASQVCDGSIGLSWIFHDESIDISLHLRSSSSRNRLRLARVCPILSDEGLRRDEDCPDPVLEFSAGVEEFRSRYSIGVEFPLEPSFLPDATLEDFYEDERPKLALQFRFPSLNIVRGTDFYAAECRTPKSVQQDNFS